MKAQSESCEIATPVSMHTEHAARSERKGSAGAAHSMSRCVTLAPSREVGSSGRSARRLAARLICSSRR
eukprot:6208237-Pleurochrysis_carterae.AAC.5